MYSENVHPRAEPLPHGLGWEEVPSALTVSPGLRFINRIAEFQEKAPDWGLQWKNPHAELQWSLYPAELGPEQEAALCHVDFQS